MKTKQDLVDKLIKQFVDDANSGDTTVIDELLMRVTPDELIPCLPEEDWSEFNHLKVDVEKQVVIDKIKTIIAEWGAFSCADAEADGSPVYNILVKTHQLMEFFNGEKVEIVTYVYDNESGSMWETYENLSMEQLEEVYKLALKYEVMQIAEEEEE